MKNLLLTLLGLVLLAGFALAVPSGDISDSAIEMYEETEENEEYDFL